MVAEVADGGPWFAGGAGTARSIDDLIAKKTWSQHSGVANFAFAGRIGTVSPHEYQCSDSPLLGYGAGHGQDH